MSQSTASHHLALLVDAGLITRGERSRSAWCHVVPERRRAVQAVLAPQ